MFGAIKKLFGKKAKAARSEPAVAPLRTPEPGTKFTAWAKGKTTSPPPPAGAPPSARPLAAARMAPVRHQPSPASAGDDALVNVPFASILSQVPAELHGQLDATQAGKSCFALSRQDAVEQLAHGAVKVSFGELRQAAPAGLFVNSSNYDDRMVSLPLQEILSQLSPASLSRRSGQRTVEVGDDVPDLFGPQASQLSQPRVLSKKEAQTTMTSRSGSRPFDPKPPIVSRPGAIPPTASAQARTAQTTPTSQPLAPRPQASSRAGTPAVPPTVAPHGRLPQAAPVPPGLESKPAPAPKISAPSLPSMAPGTPGGVPAHARLPQPSAGGPAPQSRSTPAPKIPAPSLPAMAPAAPGQGWVPPSASIPKAGGPTAETKRGTAAQASPSSLPPSHAGKAASSVSADSQFVVSLLDLVQAWPDQIQLEVARLDIPDAQCALPGAEVGAAIKRGKLEYSWQKIHSWIEPKPSTAYSPELADTVLELPLKLIVPLYLARMKRTMAAKQPAVDDAVPDLFTKTGGPTAGAAAPAGTPTTARSTPTSPAPDAKQSASPARTADAKATLPLNLAALCANWPENIRKEIEGFKLGSLTLEVPFDAIEAGLRYGKVDFLWKQVCGWIQGRPDAVPTSATADARVELPLNVVAPLFLKHRPSPKPNKRSEVAANIPDLFRGGSVPPPPPPAAAPAEPVSPASAAPPSPPPEPAPAPAAKKPPQDIAELFGEPDKRNWTPNEIVHRTSALPGVAGTLIALQDGLLVAQCMPPEWKTETVAAFLPQIFGRMSQYTKELKMGEVKNITLVVEQGVLQIFAAGIIYFAALAKAGAQLPQLELNLIATELSRHTK